MEAVTLEGGIEPAPAPEPGPLPGVPVLGTVVVFILSSSKQEAMKLKPRNSSCAFALGGTPGESIHIKILG